MAARQQQIRSVSALWRRLKCRRKKRGEKIGYSGHKHQKGEKVLTITDKSGNIIAPFVNTSVNVHDSQLILSAVSDFVEFADLLDLDVLEKPFALDSGFDAMFIRNELTSWRFVPIIKPRVIFRKNQTRTNEILDEFESVKHIYKGRFVIERTFAWEDTYRKLNTRYEKLNCTFNGFRYLAYSMINFRWLFGKNR